MRSRQCARSSSTQLRGVFKISLVLFVRLSVPVCFRLFGSFEYLSIICLFSADYEGVGYQGRSIPRKNYGGGGGAQSNFPTRDHQNI